MQASIQVQSYQPVLPPCIQFFSYPNYSLPPTTETINPGSRTILTCSACKENVTLSMTYTTTKQFYQPPCFPSRCSPNLASINTPHPMMTQYTRQQTSTYYSQRSSTTGYCGYNSYVYPPHQQQLHKTDPTNMIWS